MDFLIDNPSYPSDDLSLPTAVRFRILYPNSKADYKEDLPFNRPVKLTMEYNMDMLDIQKGFMEKYVRIFKLAKVGSDDYKWFVAPEYQIVNYSSKTVTMFIDILEEDQNEADGTGGLFGTLPVVTVDENSVSVKSSGGSSASLRLYVAEQSGPILQPESEGAYTIHTIEFPGYALCDPSDTDGITVTIRQSNLTERVGFQTGYTYFPNQSGAVFTIETKDYQDNSVAFSSPVNLTVQYLVDPAPDMTDVVDFNNNPGQENQMRICKSETANPPDYSFIGGTQTVNTTLHTVSIDNLSDLTKESGICMYGAVVDTSVQPSFVLVDWELFE